MEHKWREKPLDFDSKRKSSIEQCFLQGIWNRLPDYETWPDMEAMKQATSWDFNPKLPKEDTSKIVSKKNGSAPMQISNCMQNHDEFSRPERHLTRITAVSSLARMPWEICRC